MRIWLNRASSHGERGCHGGNPRFATLTAASFVTGYGLATAGCKILSGEWAHWLTGSLAGCCWLLLAANSNCKCRSRPYPASSRPLSTVARLSLANISLPMLHIHKGRPLASVLLLLLLCRNHSPNHPLTLNPTPDSVSHCTAANRKHGSYRIHICLRHWHVLCHARCLQQRC